MKKNVMWAVTLLVLTLNVSFAQQDIPEYNPIKWKQNLTSDQKTNSRVILENGLKNEEFLRHNILHFCNVRTCLSLAKTCLYMQHIALEHIDKKQELRDALPNTLFNAIVAKNITLVEQILNKCHYALSERAINHAFVKTFKGRRGKHRLNITKLFLEHPKIKEKLAGKSLDKAFIKFVEYRKRDLYSLLLRDKTFREKIFEDETMLQAFERTLEHLAKKKKKYYKEFIRYPELKKKAEYLNLNFFDPTEHLTILQEHGLFEALQKKNSQEIKQLVGTLDEEIINNAFIETATNQPHFKFSYLPFLEHSELKKTLTKKTLCNVIEKCLQYRLKNLFLILLQDDALRKKFYEDDETKETLKQALKTAWKKKKKRWYVKKFLSDPVLHENFKDFNL